MNEVDQEDDYVKIIVDYMLRAMPESPHRARRVITILQERICEAERKLAEGQSPRTVRY